MSEISLTDEQRLAVTAPHHAVIEAAAGSGKTRVLVERFLALLMRDRARRPSELLAITFTKRAAAEMRARLHGRLREIAEGASSGEARAHARACLDDFHRAAVMTIHAFATEVLRRHPFEAALDPAFDVVDAVEAGHAREDAVDRLLQDIGAGPDNHALRPAAVVPLRAWGHRRTAGVLRELLSADQIDTATWEEIAGTPPTETLRRARSAWAQWAAPLIAQAVVAPNASLMRAAAAALEQDPCGDEPDLPVAAWPRLVRSLLDSRAPVEERAAALDAFLPLVLTADGKARRGIPKPFGRLASGTKETLSEVIAELGRALAPLAAHWVSWREPHEREAAALAQALARLVLQARRDLDERRDAEAWLDFGDLLRRAADLVESEPARVAAAVARRFHGILIDEFQDTDPAQWRLVRALLAAARGRLPVMLVGDPRQSIYRFRGAAVQVFGQARDELARDGGPDRFRPVTMDINHRATPGLIHAVNAIFADLLPRVTAATSAPMGPPEMRAASSPRTAAHRPWPIALHLLAVPSGDDSPDLLAAEAEAVAAVVAVLVRAPERWAQEVWGTPPPADFHPRPGDIAILLRAMTHVGAFESALRDAQIPFHTGGGAGLAGRQEIRDLAHLLRFLAQPEDDQALLGLLRTPWMGWSDDLLLKVTVLTCGLAPDNAPPLWNRVRRVQRRTVQGVSLTGDEWACVERTRALLGRALVQSLHTSPAAVACEVLDAAGAWGLVRLEPEGRRRLANLRRGLERLRQHRALGFESVHAAAETLRRLVVSEAREGEEQITAETEDVVHLLTIHGAKGLEFPIVLLPQLHAQRRHGEKTCDWSWDPARGFGVRAPDPDQRWRPKRSALMKIFGITEEREARAEEARLLYVAMTRAERMLVLSGAVRGPLAEATGAQGQDSSLAWILDALAPNPGDLAGTLLRPPSLQPYTVAILSPERCRALAAPPSPSAREGAGSGRGVPQLAAAEAQALTRIAPLPLRPDPARPVSITALAAFARCPNLHFLSREAGQPRQDWFHSPRGAVAPGPRASVVGALFHRWVETHLRMPGPPWEDVAQDFFRERGEPLDPEAVRRVDALWQAFQTLPVAADLARADEAHPELDILVDLPDGPLHGRLDLLARWGNHWEVIDFKTSPQSGDDAALRARHRVQMLCYLLFLSARAPAQPTLAARLVFPALGRETLISVPVGEIPAAEAEIGALVRRFKTDRGRLHPVWPHEGCAGCPFEALPLCRAVSARGTRAPRSGGDRAL